MAVRVRIVRPLAGIIEGQPLSQYMTGLVYDVEQFLAMQLIATHGAVEEPFPEPGDLVHDDDMDHMEGPMMGGVHVIQADTADDRPTRRRTRRQQP